MDTISSLVCWPSLLSVSWGFPLGANDDIDSRKFDAARANTKHALGMVTETYLLVVFVTSAQVHARACGLGTVMTSRIPSGTRSRRAERFKRWLALRCRGPAREGRSLPFARGDKVHLSLERSWTLSRAQLPSRWP